jgi:deoxyadenosine/deoxycytidine kinase
MTPTPTFITIAGNIGVGKSTLVTLLAQRLGWEPILEAVAENPYLADFYSDMQRWSFHSQLFFLARRLQQHHDLLQKNIPVIQDRSIYEDAEIFARNLHHQQLLSDRDWTTYHHFYQTLTRLLRPPDLVIYLRASLPTLHRRIAQRGRDYEQSISPAYLAQLNTLYDQWAAAFTLSPLLTVETDNLDYLQHPHHLHQIHQRIHQTLFRPDHLTLT